MAGSVTKPAVARKSNPCCHPEDPAVTVRVTIVVGAKPPPVAFTVIEYVPVGVLAPTVTVIAELPEPGAGIVLGLKLTVVPEGAPDAVKLTALLNPPPIAVVTVDVACVPCTVVNEAGDADTVRLGWFAVTVRLTVVVCRILPPEAVTVIG